LSGKIGIPVGSAQKDVVISVESTEGNGRGDTLTEVGEDGSELVSFSRPEGSVMGQIVDKDIQSVTEDGSRNEGSDNNEPPGHILDQIHDSELSEDESDGKIQRERIMLH